MADRFMCAPGLKLHAHERLVEVKLSELERRLDHMERLLERWEKRLWPTVYGVVAVILAQAVQGFLVVAP